MKKITSLLTLAIGLLLANQAQAQFLNTTRLDSTSNGTTVDMNGGTLTLRDDDSQGTGAPNAGSYQKGIDYSITINSGCPDPSRIAVYIDELEVSCLDTIYIYDGPSTTGNLITKFNSFTGNVSVGDYIYESPANNTGMITIRFVTDDRTDSTRLAYSCHKNNPNFDKGFKFSLGCNIPCETVTPVIEDEFYRTRNGQIYDTAYIHEITVYDSATMTYNSFIGANLCIGDGVIFKGHGIYTHKFGYYDPSDATTYFRWDMDYEGDTVTGIGATQISYTEYQRTGCYDIRLDLTDEYGCQNNVVTTIKVRTAQNPIKTIFTLQDICNRDSLMVNMGYDGDNATLTLSRIQSDSNVSKTFENRTFIPDGDNCATPSYFEAPVEFTEFPNNRQVNSAADICSICINMEHSAMGDIYVTLVCPTDQEAILKFGRVTTASPPGLPSKTTDPGGEHGNLTRLGLPLQKSPWDSGTAGNKNCDSTENPYGIGLDYCFSRDTAYTLVTGDNAGDVWTVANPHPSGNFYIGSSAYIDNMDVTDIFPAVEPWFKQAGQVPKIQGNKLATKHPSNHDEKNDYYLPYTTFDELVGCPLNGQWRVRVYDVQKLDNGWIFNWTMDICDVTPGDCNYQVGIDSLIWIPDPSPQYHDYELGHYRGAVVHQKTPIVSYILTPDTAGTFPILVHIYDEFGCEWDTVTRITSYWTPQPDLGADTALCGIDRMVIDATDEHAATQNYTYAWSPFGETSDTIMTTAEPGTDINYVVEVTNTQNGYTCVTRDTILVSTRRQPMPSVIPDPYVFEGCDPFTLTFRNTSIDADEHLWVFGDGTTSTLAEPTHTYTAGNYDLRYYATSADGCVDSIISPNAISVFVSPNAAFEWSPTYPSVVDPMVHFVNRTTPYTPETKFFWEVQYNLGMPHSVQTLRDDEPIFDITEYAEGNPAGNYSVRLIARTDNLAPSGNMIYCADSATNNILVINDFLQFPNLVTPNDDGVNDVFEIVNLVDGLAYPINSLSIYNRWGTRVYHRENISNHDDAIWDPKDVPSGTYYFHFSARGYNGNIERNGVIEVLR